MSSNAISLSQQDVSLGFSPPIGAGGGQYYLAPEMHDYRRLSAHFPPDFGLTQPATTYRNAGSRLEPDPYVRNTYSNRRKRRSHSSSRNRIPGERNSQIHVEGNGFNTISNRLKPEDARLPGQKLTGASRSITNLSSSSRPPRYSARNYMGSQEQLQAPEDGGSSAHCGSFDGISAALPVYAVGQALTQPVGVYPEEGETSVGIGWSQKGRGSTRPSAKSTRKVVEANTKEQEGKEKERNVQRTISLSPPQITVETEESSQVKANGGLLVGAAATAISTGSTHHPNGVTSSSENPVAKAANNQEEVPIVWEVIINNNYC